MSVSTSRLEPVNYRGGSRTPRGGVRRLAPPRSRVETWRSLAALDVPPCHEVGWPTSP